MYAKHTAVQLCCPLSSSIGCAALRFELSSTAQLLEPDQCFSGLIDGMIGLLAAWVGPLSAAWWDSLCRVALTLTVLHCLLALAARDGTRLAHVVCT